MCVNFEKPRYSTPLVHATHGGKLEMVQLGAGIEENMCAKERP
jgi:hypothetical protein